MKTCRCGMTISDMAQGNRMGCPNCYNVFRDEITVTIRPIQMRDEHTGKVVSKAWKLKVDKLKKRMERAAARDDFEAATQLRDQIQELEREHAVQAD